MLRENINSRILLGLIVFFLFFNKNILPAQKKEGVTLNYFKPELVNDYLPQMVKESSGLIFYKNKLLTLNDGGNEPCIYAIDDKAQIVTQKICISNAQNNDWEALSYDSSFIYVSDVGNNKGTRNNFQIYKFSNKALNSRDTNIIADIITFSYADKKNEKFDSYSQWDCEAMVCINDTLVLFSKNWEEPYCSIYILSTLPGNYQLKAFKKIYLDGLVTDADYNSATKSLVLLGYSDFMPFLYFFKNFNLNDIKLKSVKRYNFQKLIGVQAEGVAFLNDSTIVFTSEYNPLISGSLYKINIPK